MIPLWRRALTRRTAPARTRFYGADGKLVRALMNETREHGGHDVAWDGRDDAGAAVGSGVYFYHLTAGKHSESKKMILLK